MADRPTHPSDGGVGEVGAGGENDEHDERRKSSGGSRRARKGAIFQSSHQTMTAEAAVTEVEALHI